MDNVTIINSVISALDQLTVQGAKNMNIVLECIRALGTVRGNLAAESEGKDVEDKTGRRDGA